MTPFDDGETPLTELRALRSEIREWAFGIRCVFTVLNVLPLYYCTRLLLAAPRFQSIFEDMIGSAEKLPFMTRLIFEHFILVLAGVWLVAASAIALIFTLKHARHVWITAVVSSFVLIATGHLAATMLVDPLITVIQNLSGGGEISP